MTHLNTVPENLILREITKHDNVNALSLGNASYVSLKAFLRKRALRFHVNNLVKTYVLVDDSINSSRIWGYASLMCSEINLDDLTRQNKGEDFENYTHYPSIKLTRLAIDQKLQRKGYGLVLLNSAITIARDYIMPRVGCRFLIVDSKPEAIHFYEKAGFKGLSLGRMRANATTGLFLDLNGVG